MRIRLGSVIAALAMVFAVAGPVSAYDHTNLAGNVISGRGTSVATDPDGSVSGCMGTIYGKVNNNLVLFTARHCNQHDFNNAAVQAPNGTMLGHWSNNAGNSTNYSNIGQYDMSFIWLNVGQRPYIKNQIYRGNVAGNDFWTNTYSMPPASMLNSTNLQGNTVYRMQQEVGLNSTKPFVSGPAGFAQGPGSSNMEPTIISNNCLQTSGIDSGAPFMMYMGSTLGYQLLGTGTATWGAVCWWAGDIPVLKYDVATNWSQAIRDLNFWVLANYGEGSGGAYFCWDADCT